ncbi:tetratricopeptide repeat protein [Chamaesiphon sp.]|uniref:tetratricopeptide repeat protein n=1 Tax=Chamaesiphon sp. TaxID=2814140 RepID=UPI00359402E8
MDAYIKRGYSKSYLNDYQRTIEDSTEAIKLDIKKKEYIPYNNRGLALFHLGENEKSLKDFDRCHKIYPQFSLAYHNEGLVFSNLKNYNRTIKSYSKAIQYEPDNYDDWNRRGDAFLRLNKYKQAISDYDRALKGKSDDYITWTRRSIALYNLKKYKEADYSWNKALEYNPDKALEYNPDYDYVWYGKARMYGLKTELLLAVKNLKKAIILNPKYKEKAKTDDAFDLIREQPIFQAVLFENKWAAHYFENH